MSEAWDMGYLAARERFERWTGWMFLVPFASLLAVLVGSVLLIKLFNPVVGLVAFLYGGLAAGVTAFLVVSDKLGLPEAAALNCPDCRIPVSRWNGVAFVIDFQCRRCGRAHARLAE